MVDTANFIRWMIVNLDMVVDHNSLKTCSVGKWAETLNIKPIAALDLLEDDARMLGVATPADDRTNIAGILNHLNTCDQLYSNRTTLLHLAKHPELIGPQRALILSIMQEEGVDIVPLKA